MKKLTAILLTFGLFAQSLIMPIFFQWYKKQFDFTSEQLTPLWIVLGLYVLGYLVVTLASWIRVFSNNDKWFS